MESDKTEAHTANYTFLKLRVSDISHSKTPAGDKWHAGLGAISKARVTFLLSTDPSALGCNSQKIKTEGNAKFPPIHTLKSEKLSVSSASSVWAHHQMQNLILLPAGSSTSGSSTKETSCGSMLTSTLQAQTRLLVSRTGNTTQRCVTLHVNLLLTHLPFPS